MLTKCGKKVLMFSKNASKALYGRKKNGDKSFSYIYRLHFFPYFLSFDEPIEGIIILLHMFDSILALPLTFIGQVDTAEQ
jgi:hypothetical protein